MAGAVAFENYACAVMGSSLSSTDGAASSDGNSSQTNQVQREGCLILSISCLISSTARWAMVLISLICEEAPLSLGPSSILGIHIGWFKIASYRQRVASPFLFSSGTFPVEPQHSARSDSVVKYVIIPGVVQEIHFPFRRSSFFSGASHEPTPLVRIREKEISF